MKSIEETKKNDYLYFLKGFDNLNKGFIAYSYFISSLNIAGILL